MTNRPSDMTTKDGATIRRGQIRPALRAAIRLIVEDGLSINDAAKRVGYNPISLQVALRKPHVVVVRDAVKRAWLDSKTAKAWRNMADLAEDAASEDVKFKANKLFLDAAGELGGAAGPGTGPATLVQIVLNHGQQGAQPLSNRLPGVIEHQPEQRGKPEPSNLITVGRAKA